MDEELQKKMKEEKARDHSANGILLTSLLDVLLVIVEFYFFTCMPELLPAMVGVGLAILFDSYFLVSTIQKEQRRREEEAEDRFNNLLKSEKASYLLIRKYNEEISQQLMEIAEGLEDPFQEVIAAQKATAKVTINRSKENAEALMNSNDKLLDLVFSLEEKIDSVYAIVEESKQGNEDHLRTEMMQKQQELLSGMREMELTLRNEILQAVNKLSSVTPQVVMAPPQQMPMMQGQQMATPPMMASFEPATETPVQEEPSLADLDMELGELLTAELPSMEMEMEAEPETSLASELEMEAEPEISLEPEVDLGAESEVDLEAEPEIEPELELEALQTELLSEPIAESETVAEPEPQPQPVEEVPPMPDLSDPNKMMSPDDIAALIANMGADSEPEPVAEPEPQPQPVEEEVPPMPDLSDPNKMMSPDDIAALIANMGADSEPEPVAEEKPPMPDLSDPNKQMSADEIAALFANMT